MDRNKYEKYQSDIIVDLLKQYDIKHISMNPVQLPGTPRLDNQLWRE